MTASIESFAKKMELNSLFFDKLQNGESVDDLIESEIKQTRDDLRDQLVDTAKELVDQLQERQESAHKASEAILASINDEQATLDKIHKINLGKVTALRKTVTDIQESNLSLKHHADICVKNLKIQQENNKIFASQLVSLKIAADKAKNQPIPYSQQFSELTSTITSKIEHSTKK